MSRVLRQADLSSAVLPYARMQSELHGPGHWARVARFGERLGRLSGLPEGQRLLVQAFAWCHDLARESDGTDPEHGRRGAVLFPRVADAVFPWLTEQETAIVVTAIRHHNDGLVADVELLGEHVAVPGWEPEDVALVIACCWDADRLDLQRLGIPPDPTLMSTAVWGKVLRVRP